MELTKEFVKSCRSAVLLRDFLLQAMEQVDALEGKFVNEGHWNKMQEEKK